MLTVETYYWNVVVLKAKLETLDAIDRMTSNLLKDVEASVSAGITTNNDLLQVKLKQNDIESKRITLEGQLQLSRMVLGQYIGEYADSIDVASGIDGGYVPDDPAYLHCDHRAALYDTEEYKLLGKNIDAVKLQYKQTVGKYMPTVAIGGGYMCDNIMDHSHPFWIGFTTVSIPLTDWWGGSHAMKKSKLEMRMAENNLDDGTDLLLIKMQKALSLQQQDKRVENLS